MAGQDAASIGQAALDAFNAGDWAALKSALASDSVYVEHGTQRRITGRDAIVEAYQVWKTAMPDVKGHVSKVLTGGDSAAFELTWKGTHTGPLPTPSGAIPASGKKQETPGVFTVDVKDGKIQHSTNYFDMLTLLQQIGAAPS
jgi:steroid delta-isomerase-like uncharacterized protein